MKVKCINTGSNVDITVGKAYEVEVLESDYYEIVNDKGRECSYQKDRFEVVPEIEVSEVVKVTLDLPVIEGFEYINEYREVVGDEHYLTVNGDVGLWIGSVESNFKYPILKKKAPKYEVITQGDFLQLCEGRRVGHVDLSARYVEIKALEDAMWIIESMSDNDGIREAEGHINYEVLKELIK